MSNVTSILSFNNYKLFEVRKAKVTKIDAEAHTASVTIGETTIDLVNVDMPSNVAVGNSIDFTCHMLNNSSNVFAKVLDSAKIIRYYDVKFDADGDDGVEKTKIESFPMGEEVTVTATLPDERYEFKKWVKVTDTGEEDASTAKDYKFKVEGDVTLKAVFDFVPEKLNAFSYDKLGTIDAETSDATNITILTEGDLFTADAWKDSPEMVLIVDRTGKILYYLAPTQDNVGTPDAEVKGYYVHPDFADVTKNPALKKDETTSKWTISVPKDGFAITAKGASVAKVLNAITGLTEEYSADLAAKYSKADAFNDDVRLYYYPKNKTGVVKTFKDFGDPTATAAGLLNDVSNKAFTVYDSEYKETITLSDWTIAIDKNKNVIFMSRTSSGYGGPGDGFYHDGTYVVKAGETHGIFALDAAWKPWSADDKEESWKKYKVVVPEDGYIITGTTATMTPLFNSIIGRDDASIWSTYATASDKIGNYWENIADGRFNNVASIEITKIRHVANVVVNIENKVTKEYAPYTYTDSSYHINIYDRYIDKVNAKLAKMSEEERTGAKEVISEIFYDNVDQQMWADSGYSSIVYTSTEKLHKNCLTMIVNKEGKIEFIGSNGTWDREKSDNVEKLPETNYYLRAPSWDSSVAVDSVNNKVVIPEGGWALQVWTGSNNTETHKLAYTNNDVLRALVVSQLSVFDTTEKKDIDPSYNWVPSKTVDPNMQVGDQSTEKKRAYGDNKTLTVAPDSVNIIWSNLYSNMSLDHKSYSGFLDNLTVTKEALTNDKYFVGKITVTREHTLEFALQRSFIKTEYARVILGDEEFKKAYNGGGVNWAVDNVVAPWIERWIAGLNINDGKETDTPATYKEFIHSLYGITNGESYFGDTYKPLFATVNKKLASK